MYRESGLVISLWIICVNVREGVETLNGKGIKVFELWFLS